MQNMQCAVRISDPCLKGSSHSLANLIRDVGCWIPHGGEEWGKVRSIHLASVYAETEIMFTVCEAFLCDLWFETLGVQSAT